MYTKRITLGTRPVLGLTNAFREKGTLDADIKKELKYPPKPRKRLEFRKKYLVNSMYYDWDIGLERDPDNNFQIRMWIGCDYYDDQPSYTEVMFKYSRFHSSDTSDEYYRYFCGLSRADKIKWIHGWDDTGGPVDHMRLDDYLNDIFVKGNKLVPPIAWAVYGKGPYPKDPVPGVTYRMHVNAGRDEDETFPILYDWWWSTRSKRSGTIYEYEVEEDGNYIEYFTWGNNQLTKTLDPSRPKQGIRIKDILNTPFKATDKATPSRTVKRKFGYIALLAFNPTNTGRNRMMPCRQYLCYNSGDADDSPVHEYFLFDGPYWNRGLSLHPPVVGIDTEGGYGTSLDGGHEDGRFSWDYFNESSLREQFTDDGRVKEILVNAGAAPFQDEVLTYYGIDKNRKILGVYVCGFGSSNKNGWQDEYFESLRFLTELDIALYTVKANGIKRDVWVVRNPVHPESDPTCGGGPYYLGNATVGTWDGDIYDVIAHHLGIIDYSEEY